jgi:hypothetical protein
VAFFIGRGWLRGNYEPDVDDPKVPRFVRTAVLINEYQPEDDAVDYGFYTDEHLKLLHKKSMYIVDI